MNEINKDVVEIEILDFYIVVKPFTIDSSISTSTIYLPLVTEKEKE